MNKQIFEIEIPNHFDLPKSLNRLGELAYNLWWTWEKDCQRMYREIDFDLWEKTYHNPVKFLRQVERTRINEMQYDLHFIEKYHDIIASFDEYMAAKKTWFNETYPKKKDDIVAYLSSEFGMHETLPIYAGGLGILSGDHIKEASDLGIPMVAVGFLYTNGYFSQKITEDGWQEARYVNLKFEELPVSPVTDKKGKPLTITIDLPGRDILVRVWNIQVGRVPLYLLDSNVEGNSDADRQLTARLYSSDLDLKITQEIILGIGGVRVLRKLGYNPSSWHMNEGHSAFSSLERIRELVAEGASFDGASKIIQKNTVFTTHTPVPAGNEQFPLWLMDKYFSNLWEQLGLDRESFIDLARMQQPWGETFSMPILAIRMSAYRNGVSELHGIVARSMWQFLFEDTKVEDVPISYVTNGIHSGTWMARRLRNLFNNYFDEDWRENIDDPRIWENIKNVPDEELWEVRRHLKRKLMMYLRDRSRSKWLSDGIHPVQVVAGGALLDPYALTIGFARRFATYKRANLIFRDTERILNLINNHNRPVQIIFAGKAHPADEPGKLIIQEIYRMVKKAECGGRLVFVEDYDMNIARYLVQGVDVWLNTPRRPMEASGTSGEKAALNGVLNFSVLDGWWREGYNGKNGWAIGSEKDYADPNVQDESDALSLYETLENEIIPMYYENRTPTGIPIDWMEYMKETIRTCGPNFSMRRMVKEYTTDLYIPSIENGKKGK